MNWNGRTHMDRTHLHTKHFYWILPQNLVWKIVSLSTKKKTPYVLYVTQLFGIFDTTNTSLNIQKLLEILISSSPPLGLTPLQFNIYHFSIYLVSRCRITYPTSEISLFYYHHFGWRHGMFLSWPRKYFEVAFIADYQNCLHSFLPLFQNSFHFHS